MTPEKFHAAPSMYKQVANHLAGQIFDGTFPTGCELPSENDLIQSFGVSRATVRSAMAELRAMGLVDSSRGKRSVVRTPTASAAATVERTVSRSGKTYRTGSGEDWHDAEPPTVTRTHASGTTAELLERDGEQTFTVDRLLTDSTGSRRAAHRLTIPFDVAADCPVLADNPDRMSLAEIYAALATIGQTLTWREFVSARAPHPDERTSLWLTDYAAPILLVTRVTLAADGRPLLLEELRVSADQVRLAFTITAKAPARPRS